MREMSHREARNGGGEAQREGREGVPVPVVTSAECGSSKERIWQGYGRAGVR